MLLLELDAAPSTLATSARQALSPAFTFSAEGHTPFPLIPGYTDEDFYAFHRVVVVGTVGTTHYVTLCAASTAAADTTLHVADGDDRFRSGTEMILVVVITRTMIMALLA
jgi:hypothetical protein